MLLYVMFSFSLFEFTQIMFSSFVPGDQREFYEARYASIVASPKETVSMETVS